jgi:hypothetical protein
MGANVSACPSLDILERLLGEKLTGAERDSVETHVENCTSCQGQLERFVAGTLREAVRPAAPVPEPAEAFLSRLRELPPPQPGDSLRIRAPVPPDGGDAGHLRDAATGIPAWLQGGRLGQYEILGKLGHGGMGTVYKARHTELGKIVALKVLPVQQMDEVSVGRFKNEIRAIGKLDHPNIVVAHDAGESRGVHFLVMELIDGMDLARIVERHGRLPVPDACEAIRQAASGLQHAFERGLVHRDIKPPNLMLARDGRVRLLDLGLARSFGEAHVHTLTAHGSLLGTADYLAPEQWDHPHAADTRADVYSLGCTLYHLLAGRPPFAGALYSTVMRKMRAHQEVPPPPVGQFCPEVPAELAALVHRMLAKDPAERFATPAEVGAALRPFTAGADLGRLLDGDVAAGGAASADVVTPTPGAWETDRERRARGHVPARRPALPVILAGLGLLFAVALIARPWFQGAPIEPAGQPLVVKDLRVEHYRDKGNGAELIGELWSSPVAVRLNDQVRILSTLNRDAYYYLIALNPPSSDIAEQLCQPEDEGGKKGNIIPPSRQTEVQYPRGTKGFQVDAVGLQVFVLAATTKPLPPFKEWQNKAGEIPWEGGKDGGTSRWHFDGREFVRYPRERGRVVPLTGEPNSLLKLRDFFRKRPDFDVVQIVAFPVVDDRK